MNYNDYVLPRLEDPSVGNTDIPNINIRQLLVTQRAEMPIIHDTDKNNPEQFFSELRAREIWQRGYSLKFFQEVLGIQTIVIARKLHEKLKDFMGEDNVNLISRDTISSYLTGERRWTRRNLFLICMALGINKNDPEKQNVKVLFELLGLTYARFANPIDIVFTWAVEHDYTYQQLINLLDRTKEFCFELDLRAGYEKLKADSIQSINEAFALEGELKRRIDEMPYDYTSHYKCGEKYDQELHRHKRPVDYRMTNEIEGHFRDIWNCSEEVLIERMRTYKNDFHYFSVSRARVVEKLVEKLDKDGKYVDMIDGHTFIERDDIIGLAIECRCNLETINKLLTRAYFAPIGPDGRTPEDSLYWSKYLQQQAPLR